MWISDFAISKRVVTTVVVLAIVVFGGIALVLLDTDEFPEVNPPVISVSIPYPGAAPGTVERELVDPLEEAFRSISGVDEIQSTAVDGFASIIVVFLFEKDLQQASQDIRDSISEIRRELPDEIEEPVLTRFDPQDLPIVSLTISSDTVPLPRLTSLADPGIVGQLRGVSGVADVRVVGGVERELTVELRPEAMEAAGIGVAEVVQALGSENLAAPVGRIVGDVSERTIRLRGRLQTPEEFEALVVRRTAEGVVRLGDVADAKDGAEEPRSMALFNGRPAVGIDVKKTTGSSTTAVSARIAERIERVRKTLPDGVRLDVVRDSGVRVEQSVSNVEESLVLGALLTVLVVFLFLQSWRSTIITGLALPVSVLASFIAVWAWGFTLNTMSLLGLSLAIGILIDDAIVVRENIVRHLATNPDHVAAAREGTSEIGRAVTATTFSIVVVFVPIAFMGGVAEQWFAPFALTMACAVMVSLFISFSLDPMLSAAWHDPEATGEGRSWLSRRLAFVDRGLEHLTAGYRRVIGWALRHRLAMVIIAIGSFVGALAMPAMGVVGSEFFPTEDSSEIVMRLETPAGSSLEYTRRKVLEATRLARKQKGVLYSYATIGSEQGSVDEGQLYVKLSPRDERARTQEEIERALRSEIEQTSGLDGVLTSGFGEVGDIQIRLSGPDLETLNRLADRVAAKVREVKGATDVGLSTRGQRPELEVTLDRPLAGELGVTAAQVAQALRPAFAGLDAGDWVDPQGETRDVVVRLRPEARRRPEDLQRMGIVLPAGDRSTIVPLGHVADIRTTLGPAQIQHHDGERVVTVRANTDGRPLSAVIGEIQAKLARMPIPPGVTISQGGETEGQQEVFGRIFVAIGVAILLMYLILVIQFESFLDPLPIMASLPLSLIGVMLGLLFTGSTLNLMSMIGVILLMGIVAKNAILLIDFAKISERAGMTREEAIVEAGGVRLRPILMTSVAIVAGMLPIAIGGGEGGQFRAPLGRAVIGGVITSTLLTLLVIPTFYDILANARDRVIRRVRKSTKHPKPATHPAPGTGTGSAIVNT